LQGLSPDPLRHEDIAEQPPDAATQEAETSLVFLEEMHAVKKPGQRDSDVKKMHMALKLDREGKSNQEIADALYPNANFGTGLRNVTRLLSKARELAAAAISQHKK
jgi:hypothetical protein